MKLYEIPEKSKIKVHSEDGTTHILTFLHLDGMYSLCETDQFESVHLSVNTPLEKEGDYYIIK